MTMRRRLAFASPFVLVVGCGQPAEQAAPAPRPPAPLGPEPTDAIVADAAAEVDAFAPVDQSAPPARTITQGTAPNPPPVLRGRVLTKQARDGRVTLIVGTGTLKGVTSTSRCRIESEQHFAAGDDDCQVVHVEKATTSVTTKLTIEQLRPYAWVRFGSM
jgi:hypothetical protein